MKGRWFLGLIAAMIAVTGAHTAASAQGTVAPCSNANNCAQVTVTGGSGGAGTTVPVALSFRQASSNGPGGPGDIAALALTLSIAPGGNGVPLRLADCTATADGLPAAVKPDAAISNFKVVVENAFCDGGRTHCLCPSSGTPDNFINLVVYGPNPLPTPGPNPITIPALPAGPQTLVTIDLAVQGSASGTIPLHVYTETQDAQHPQFTAFLSVGDTLAVDQTCVPVTGQPPCSGSGNTSQVMIADGQVAAGTACVGDCQGDKQVTVDDLLTIVNIDLGDAPFSSCPAGDSDGDGKIMINDILVAVNTARMGACQ